MDRQSPNQFRNTGTSHKKINTHKQKKGCNKYLRKAFVPKIEIIIHPKYHPKQQQYYHPLINKPTQVMSIQQMKILFSHGGVIKLFPIQKGNPKNYENMRRFIQTNLSKVPPNFIVKYKDEEGNMLVIENNKDIECLFGNNIQDYVRASIEDESLVLKHNTQLLSENDMFRRNFVQEQANVKQYERKQKQYQQRIKQLQKRLEKSEAEKKEEKKVDGKQEFYNLLIQNGIGDITVEILKSEDIRSLYELREIKDEDLKALGLKLGEIIRLKKIK